MGELGVQPSWTIVSVNGIDIAGVNFRNAMKKLKDATAIMPTSTEIISDKMQGDVDEVCGRQYLQKVLDFIASLRELPDASQCLENTTTHREFLFKLFSSAPRVRSMQCQTAPVEASNCTSRRRRVELVRSSEGSQG